jgi:phosphatidylglycerophosphatase C
MPMNVYDFDDTIYEGDSENDFVRYVFAKFPFRRFQIRRDFAFLLYRLKLLSLTHFEVIQFRFLPQISNVDQILEEFWDSHQGNIKKWYLESQKEDDVIISASPEFLLSPIIRRLKIKTLIATRMDKMTGKIDGLDNYGSEKVPRFQAVLDSRLIDAFFSDSQSDRFLARIAKKAFLVKGDKITAWK